MTKLKSSSLNWGLKHTLFQKDNSLFPFPFEFDIIKNQWNFLRDELLKIEIQDYKWKEIRGLIIPKSEKTFRKASQLNPLDYIIFSAIIKEIGKKIEKKRIPVKDNIVFSSRFRPDIEGRMYDNKNAWKNFWEQSRKMANKYKYIVTTDIVDFYNQIYHHTIENQLMSCGIHMNYINAIKNLIQSFTGKVSRGIPIGPHSFHLLAELSLIPVDEYLKLKGTKFCRFLDDYHFFCNSKEEGLIAIYDFVNVLDDHKLVMQYQKTKILHSESFKKTIDNKITEDPINDEEKEIIITIKQVSDDPYDSFTIEELKADELDKFSKDKIEKIFKELLLNSPPNYEHIRWFLRRLSQVGIGTGVDFIIRNIDEFKPALADAMDYLKNAKSNYVGNWNKIGNELHNVLFQPLVQKNEYMRLIIVNLFSKIIDLDHIEKLIDLYDNVPSNVKRKILLAAIVVNAYPFLKSFKTEIRNMDPWLKRAMIYGSKTFPEDEKGFWLRSINKLEIMTLLDKAIIKELS
ncbi:MAG: RNA-directed DNA polymerase [Promethearchaeota archaeon]